MTIIIIEVYVKAVCSPQKEHLKKIIININKKAFDQHVNINVAQQKTLEIKCYQIHIY